MLATKDIYPIESSQVCGSCNPTHAIIRHLSNSVNHNATISFEPLLKSITNSGGGGKSTPQGGRNPGPEITCEQYTQATAQLSSSQYASSRQLQCRSCTRTGPSRIPPASFNITTKKEEYRTFGYLGSRRYVALNGNVQALRPFVIPECPESR